VVIVQFPAFAEFGERINVELTANAKKLVVRKFRAVVLIEDFMTRFLTRLVNILIASMEMT
jgi:hypothetical protein